MEGETKGDERRGGRGRDKKGGIQGAYEGGKGSGPFPPGAHGRVKRRETPEERRWRASERARGARKEERRLQRR